MEEFFRAYFCGGIDLTDREELIEVAVAAGLERGRVDRMLSSGEGLSEVRREEREFKELGITAVPFFIIADRLAVSGAQPTETLIRALEQAMSPEPTSKSRKKAAAAVDPSCRL